MGTISFCCQQVNHGARKYHLSPFTVFQILLRLRRSQVTTCTVARRNKNNVSHCAGLGFSYQRPHHWLTSPWKTEPFAIITVNVF